MEDDKITRLTAEINRFAISQNWLPKTDYDTVWQIWKELTTNAPPPTETIPNTVMHKLLPIWEQCYTILNGLLQNRNAYPFERPVDPIRDGVPNYFEVVKKPMDLKTVKERLALTVRRRHEPLKADMYRYPDQFKADMDQIWENCFLYNPPGYQVRDMGAALKNDFEQRWKTMKIESQVARILKESSVSGFKAEADDNTPSTISGKPLSKRKPLSYEGLVQDKRDQEGIPHKAPKHNQIDTSHDRTRPSQECKVTKAMGAKSQAKAKNIPREIEQKVSNTKQESGGFQVKDKGSDINRQKGTQVAKKKFKGTAQRDKLRNIVRNCTKSTTVHEKPSNALKPSLGEWKPPIERGGDRPFEIAAKPIAAEPVRPGPSKDVIKTKDIHINAWKECEILNQSLKKMMEQTMQKREEEMSDFEVRRRFSIVLETLNSNPLKAILRRIFEDVQLADGVLSIDDLEIKKVRRILRAVIHASNKKKGHTESSKTDSAPSSEKPRICQQRVESPKSATAQLPVKRKRADDEGSRWETKTPLVRPPSPPWHRRLTQKCQVWKDAVELCGIAPRLDGSDLGLTPRQESNGSSWEEAVPDDIEDGEILD